MLGLGEFNVVSLNDWHIPFHDHKALVTAFDFCKRLQPQIIILHELHDFYALSRFDKDPGRIESLQDELDLATEYLWHLRNQCPDSRLILLKSNHLDRLRKYLWKHAPALHSLRSLKIPELLRLKDFNIEFQDDYVHQGIFLWKHGDLIRKDAGLTARAELTKEGMSGCSGHTHRLAQIYKRLRGGKFTWLESGCLCQLNPTWMGTANWQLGFTLTSFLNDASRHFFATLVPIIDYRTML